MGEKQKPNSIDSEDDGDDDEARDTFGPLPTISSARKGRQGIPVAEMGTVARKRNSQRRASQSFAVDVSDLAVAKVAGDRRLARSRHRSETL